VLVPTNFSIPYTDLELTTPDDVKIFLLLQRTVLNMGEMPVEWDEGSPSDEEVRQSQIIVTVSIPKDLRNRGKGNKKSEADAQPPTKEPELIDECPSSRPSWIVSRAPDSNQDQVNSDAPFGYVDPEMKAYFRTVEDWLKEWQQN